MDMGINQCVFPAKIGAGRYALEHLPFDLSGFGASKPLVICTSKTDNEGGLVPLIQAFKGSGLALGVYTMEGECTPAMLKEAWGHYNGGGFDSLIAVGGGSVVDLAKCLTVAGGDSPDALRDLMQGGTSPASTAAFAWVPTLEMNGRESSPVTHLGEKTFQSMVVVPKMITIDPRMMTSAPGAGLAEAALGAFASALCIYEADASGALTRPYSRVVARQVIKGLEPLLQAEGTKEGFLSSLMTRFKGPQVESEMAFVTAMALSGALYPATETSLTFALADSMVKGCRFSRNVLAAVLLPSVLEYAHRVRGEDLSDALLSLGDLSRLCATPLAQRSEASIGLIRESLNRLWFITETELPRTLSEAGVSSINVEELSRDVASAVPGWQPHEVESLLMGAYMGILCETRTATVPGTEEVA